MEDTEPWYSQQVYTRYWRHYDLAMRWMRRHQKAYRKAMESFYRLPWHPWHPAAASPSSHYADWDGNDLPHTQNYPSSYRPDVRVPYHGGDQQCAGAYEEREDADEDSEMEEDAEGDSKMEEDSESEGEIEYDLSNMEITEELRQFFAETERHREELQSASCSLLKCSFDEVHDALRPWAASGNAEHFLWIYYDCYY
ncbi:gem-associated protein 8 isoform X2 [Cyanistes caeruleus]|uniref:gem-associated protein 8 isoform X2 n=1 Tax=Cyanistes caeruleus TaxID=156563 RepID=UPI000CDB1C1E|nr:gem-associated protein 8 isoform X2 [Cyanistes caeruleus]